jgi:molybdenum cofactor synthesis domain-containing protein
MNRTAAALIIGNELLSGKIQEANLVGLAKLLRVLGVELRRVVMVPDEISLIASEVRALAGQHDVLFTSGGVGPTHDDVTIEAVALAFEARVVTSPVMEAMLRAHYRERCTDGHLRMALIPEGAELVSSAEITWPTVVMRNVWVFPGIPEVFRMKLPLLRDRLSGGTPFVSRAVYTKMDEGDLKPLLDRVVALHGEVEVGSYPKWFDPSYKTKLTFDGRDEIQVVHAMNTFLAMLPDGEPQKVE